jgi:hypothetical protein
MQLLHHMQVESWGHFPTAKQRLLQLLDTTKPKGLLILSGDVHYAEIAGGVRVNAFFLRSVLIIEGLPRRVLLRAPALVCVLALGADVCSATYLYHDNRHA